jgi:S1-C subfamily serine protease
VGSEDTAEGKLRVTKIGRESPAESAGIKVNDVILKIDGKDIKNKEMMQDLLKEKAPDDKLVILLLRGDKEIEVTVRLAER